MLQMALARQSQIEAKRSEREGYRQAYGRRAKINMAKPRQAICNIFA